MLKRILLSAVTFFSYFFGYFVKSNPQQETPPPPPPPPPSPTTEKTSQRQAPTKIPDCPLCQQEHEANSCSVPSAPPKIVNKRGRPKSIDTSAHFCPHEECSYYGWLDRGNIRSNGHPNGGPNRQLECIVCGITFMETTGTIFYRKQVKPETIWRVLTARFRSSNAGRGSHL